MMELMSVFMMVFERDRKYEYRGSGNDNNNYNMFKKRDVFIQQLR